jgi:succinyl-diaminopimelate desuccinylase
MDPAPERYVADHREAVLDLALDLLAADTSNPPGETRAAVARLEDWLASAGVTTERVAADPAKPNLLATVPGDGEGTVLFLGHLDTVPYDEAAWTRDPLGERDGDRIYGRGATDMKGNAAAMALAARRFATAEDGPPVDVQFAFASDEEVGGDAGLPALLAGDHLDADACVVGEPTSAGGRHSVTVADRGSIWLTLAATGEAAHGSRPVLGDNAIDRLYGAVETLRERFGDRELAVTDAMAPVVEESVEFYAPTMGAATARALLTRPSINLGTIEGGDAVNSVPRSARAEIDVRLLAGVETSEVLADVRDCAADCEGVTVADASWSVGTAEDVTGPLVDAVTRAAGTVVDDRVYRRTATGGGDAKTLRNAGVPTVEFGLGTGTAHAVDEFTTADAVLGNALTYARVPTAWREARATS